MIEFAEKFNQTSEALFRLERFVLTSTRTTTSESRRGGEGEEKLLDR